MGSSVPNICWGTYIKFLNIEYPHVNLLRLKKSFPIPYAAFLYCTKQLFIDLALKKHYILKELVFCDYWLQQLLSGIIYNYIHRFNCGWVIMLNNDYVQIYVSQHMPTIFLDNTYAN